MRKIIFLALIVMLSCTLLQALPAFAVEGYIWAITSPMPIPNPGPKPYMPPYDLDVTMYLFLSNGGFVNDTKTIEQPANHQYGLQQGYYQIPFPTTLPSGVIILSALISYNGQMVPIAPYTVEPRVDFTVVVDPATYESIR